MAKINIYADTEMKEIKLTVDGVEYPEPTSAGVYVSKDWYSGEKEVCVSAQFEKKEGDVRIYTNLTAEKLENIVADLVPVEYSEEKAILDARAFFRR